MQEFTDIIKQTFLRKYLYISGAKLALPDARECDLVIH